MENYYIIIAIVVGLFLFYQFNTIIYLKNRAKRSSSTIDIYLKNNKT